jgi:hypothetical protein
MIAYATRATGACSALARLAINGKEEARMSSGWIRGWLTNVTCAQYSSSAPGGYLRFTCLTQERERMMILYIPRAHWAGKIQQQRPLKGLILSTGVAGRCGLRLISATRLFVVDTPSTHARALEERFKTDTHIDRQAGRQAGRQEGRQADRRTERDTDRQTWTDRHGQRHTCELSYKPP